MGGWELAAAWVSAGSTTLAVGAATWAGMYAKRAYAKEVERDESRDLEQRRAQAELVAAWCSSFDVLEGGGTFHTAGGATFSMPGNEKPGIFLRNASHVPVYDVMVELRQGDRRLATYYTLDVLPPNIEPERYEMPERIRRSAVGGGETHGRAVRAELSFRDSGGRRWFRNGLGVLHEFTGEDPHTDDDEA